MNKSIVFALLALAGCGGSTPPAQPCPEVPAPEPVAQPAPEPVVEPAPEAQIAVGTCELDWLPPGIVEDTSPEDTQALVDVMREWIVGYIPPAIDAQRGVLHAKSGDDEGGDGPYPQHSNAQSSRVCGIASIWLRSDVLSRFRPNADPEMGTGVQCQQNVCCYPGMEYVSDGMAVFHRVPEHDGAPATWILTGAIESAEAALGEEFVTQNRTQIARSLTRLARSSCPREPAAYQ